MENRRFILMSVIGLIIYFLYQAWQTDYHSASFAQEPAAKTAGAASAAESTSTAQSGSLILVDTDRVHAEIMLDGGDIRRLELLDYPLHQDKPETKLALLNDREGHWAIFQAGLADSEHGYGGADAHFTSPASAYRLEAGADTLEVPLEFHDTSGLVLRKLYRFHRDSFEIEFEQSLSNTGDKKIAVSPYARWVRNQALTGDEQRFNKPFVGFGVYAQAAGDSSYKFKKLAFKDLGDKPYENAQTGGWIAMLQHYFVAVIIPPTGEAATYSAKPAKSLNGAFSGQYLGAVKDIAPGATQSYPLKLYVGPEAQGKLDAVAPGLELTEDYGILTPVAQPLFLAMKLFHRLSGNWGFAIILLTLTVKTLFFPLQNATYRSSAKMRKFSPRIAQLRERFADDREGLNKAMMELYKKEKFNPLAGCWPLLIQIPVFFALYSVLSGSVELRQAPLGLWITDLTSPDKFFVLPVLYGASMWLSQRMSGQAATMDPTQARIMNVMPIALTGFFAFSPAGLVLYWFVSNTIGIGQMWLIQRSMKLKEDKA